MNVSKIQVYQDFSTASVQYEKLYKKYHVDNNTNLKHDVSNKSDIDVKHILIELWIEFALEYIKCNILPCEIQSKNDYINSTVDFITFNSNRMNRIYTLINLLIKLLSFCTWNNIFYNLFIYFINECLELLNEITISHEQIPKSMLFKYEINIEKLNNTYNFVNDAHKIISDVNNEKNNTTFNINERSDMFTNFDVDFINLLNFTTSQYFNIHVRLNYHIANKLKRNKLAKENYASFTKSIEKICSDECMIHEIEQISVINNFNTLLKCANERINNYNTIINNLSTINASNIIISKNIKNQLLSVDDDEITIHENNMFFNTSKLNTSKNNDSDSEYIELIDNNEINRKPIKKCCCIM